MRFKPISTVALAAAVSFGCGRTRAPAPEPASSAAAVIPAAGAATIPADHLAGKQYRSIDELYGGLGPNGEPVPMRWVLRFGNVDGQGRGVVSWKHTDIESDREWYQLAGDGILSGSNQTAPRRYDPAADRVLWRGNWYERDGKR
ncbi:MAG TPA: hypothetical protein VGB55_11435 [Tepidisphaeraceae bacterium]|jgi:hypothetical protein